MSIDRRKREDQYVPLGVVEKSHKAAIETRKELFDKLNKFIMSHGGWVTSVSGAETVVFEVLPDSNLPWLLVERGWIVTAADPPETTRIISGSIVERLTLTSSGGYEPATENSTKPIIVRTHAGICRTLRYRFEL